MVNTTPQHTSVTALREINLGAHFLFVMSDQSIDLMADEHTPYVADNVLSLDSCEVYRLLICLQEVFKQTTASSAGDSWYPSHIQAMGWMHPHVRRATPGWAYLE